jgi:uncharacterized membrane protein YeiB
VSPLIWLVSTEKIVTAPSTPHTAAPAATVLLAVAPMSMTTGCASADGCGGGGADASDVTNCPSVETSTSARKDDQHPCEIVLRVDAGIVPGPHSALMPQHPVRRASDRPDRGGVRATTSAGRPRIAALDVLRGFALCGILLANIRPIASAGPAFVPLSSSGPADAGRWLHLLVDQRFMPIFSLLFGVGFSLLLDSAEDRVARPRLVLVRRLLVLLFIGLAHLLVLWPGDILTTYAIIGLLVLLPSTWLPRWAVLGLAAAAIAASLIFAHGGNLVIPGLFMLGSALVRYGVIDRMEQSARMPAVVGLIMAAVAAPALWWQIGLEAGDVHDPSRSIAVAGLLLAGVYVCTLLVLLRTPLQPVLHSVFAPLGQMALTNYLTATVLVLGFGRVLGDAPARWPLTTVFVIAASVLAVQWLWSKLWLRRYRYGPLEWLWRWATWGRRPPLGHGS